MADTLDALLAGIDLENPLAGGQGGGSTALDELDGLLADVTGMNLTAEPAVSPTGPPTTGAFLDDLLQDVESFASTSSAQATASSPAGFGGMGRGVYTGPGRGGRGRGVFTGPGRSRGVYTGPGRVSSTAGVARGAPHTAGNKIHFGPTAATPPHSAGGTNRTGGGVAGFATHTPDGREIKVNTTKCAHCGEAIVGKVINAMGKSFCPGHFVCEICSQPFSDGRFLEQEGKPYCPDHWYELFAPRCCRCEQPIRERLIRSLDKTFHKNHFTCLGCGCSLVGQVVKEAGGEPYCKVCIEEISIELDAKTHDCARCKKPILGEYILLKGQYFHPEHFQCFMCGADFTHGDCKTYEGHDYCGSCFDKIAKDSCKGCGHPIISRSMMAMGHVWHPEHFCCAHCHEQLSAASYFEWEGKPYCEPHFKELFGRCCDRCDMAVTSAGIEAFGKIWHEDCFLCVICDHPVGSGGGKSGFFNYQNRPHCKKCYFTMPGKQRTAWEKKIKKEAKAESKRMKMKEKEFQKAKKEAEKSARRE